MGQSRSLGDPILRVAQHGTGITNESRDPNVFKTLGLAAATAEATIWTPASGKKFRILRMILTAGAQTVLTFKDNTAGTTILEIEIAANTPLVITEAFFGAVGIQSAAADNVLTVTRGTSATLKGTIAGTEE